MGQDDLEILRSRVADLQARVEKLERTPQSRSVNRQLHDDLSSRLFTAPVKPSVESRIGSQFFNRVGIIALLVGVALFLKYAVDQRWLGPGARVLVGLGAGIGLIAWSERFRAIGFPVFSFSLKAAGTGVLYLALWAPFALFHLVPFSVALLGMILITAGNAWLCWAQRSEVLAAYALTGGFLTPALLEPPHPSVLVLGGYLILLNMGLFALMLLRRWPRLLPASFVGTICYLLAWGFQSSSLAAQHQSVEALLVTALFFLAFSIAPLFLDAAPDKWGRWLFVLTAAANAGLGTLAMYLLLPRPSFAAQWLLCGASAWFTLLLPCGRLHSNSRNSFDTVYTALAIAMAAVGMWVALERGGVILGWTLEAATLLWLARRQIRIGIHPPEQPALHSPVAPALLQSAAGGLLIGESALHLLGRARHVFVNERCALFLVLIAVCIYGVRVAERQHARRQSQEDGAHIAFDPSWGRMGAGCALLATVLLLAAGIFETHTYWGATGTFWGQNGAVAQRFAVSAWAGLLGMVLLIVGFRVRWAFLRWQALALLTLAIAKVFLLDARALTQGFRILSFLGLGALLLAVSFIYQRDLLSLRGREHGA
jgi:uncharacterized membrane protein